MADGLFAAPGSRFPKSVGRASILSGTEDAPEDRSPPHHLDPGELRFAFNPQLVARQIKVLAALAFVKGNANACLPESPGVGKAMLAMGPSSACRAGYSAYFTSLNDMLRNLPEVVWLQAMGGRKRANVAESEEGAGSDER